ncbi:MAG: hypothetical protein WBK55_06510 [Alphaproteobacteria bacterium]
MHPETEEPTVPVKIFASVLGLSLLGAVLYVPAKLDSNDQKALRVAFSEERIPDTLQTKLKPVILKRASCPELPDQDTCERVKERFNLEIKELSLGF